MSLPEVLLWRILRTRPGGFRLRRQHPCGRYVIDFVCLRARLAIELDGEAHNRGDRPARDEAREAALIASGFQVIRVAAAEVLRDAGSAAEAIVLRCGEVGPLHRPADGPPPRAGEDLR